MNEAIPIMRGRLVVVVERYGTPRVLVTSAVWEPGYPAKAFSTAADVLALAAPRRGTVPPEAHLGVFASHVVAGTPRSDCEPARR
jgi:hypothetical protein